MKRILARTSIIAVVCLFAVSQSAVAQSKIGYIDSNKILGDYKEAVDVRKQLQEVNLQWEQEAKDMQKEVEELTEQLESQSLLLSEERKISKQQEIQSLYQNYQQFVQTKWGQQGELVKKEAELLKPIYDKIRESITKIGAEESFDYIFDVANIIYVSESQADLTERLLSELNKGIPAATAETGK